MPSIGDWTLFLLRWFHFLAGITWIGMLYYFNFVQTPFFATAEAPVRSGMIVGSLVGRALWWFRWGAMLTFRGAASHFAFYTPTARGAKVTMLVVLFAIMAIVEWNALSTKQWAGKKMLTTVKGTLWGGFVLSAVFFVALKLIFA